MLKQSHILLTTESKVRLVLGTVPLALKTLKSLSAIKTASQLSLSLISVADLSLVLLRL